MKSLPLRLAAILTIASLAGLGAVALSPGARAADQPPIVIGASISQTGSYAEDAKFALAGYQLWIAQQNAKGGLLGRQLQLKTYDDASDPATAVGDYEKLINQDKVDLIVGPYSSAITAAVANVAEKYKMPMISPEVASTAPFNRGLTYIFQGIQQSTRYVEGPLALAKANGYTKIALTGEDTAFPKSVAAAVPDLAKAAGLEVVFNELYPHNASDYSSIVQKMKQSGADVVLAMAYFPDAVGVLRALKQANYSPKLYYAAVGPTELNFGQEAGKDANGTMATANWSAILKTPGNEEFTKAFTDANKTPPDYHAASNYASLQVLAAAVNKIKSLDQQKLRDALATMKMQTIMGNFELDPKTGVQVGYNSLVLQWIDGKQTIIYPASFANHKPLLPFPPWSSRGN